jgi:hypothetical protein
MPKSRLRGPATSLLKHLLLALVFIGGAATVSPARADKQSAAKIQAARADFDKVSIPTLMKMAPLIEKSAAERLAAYNSLKLSNTTCVDGAGSGFRADQVAAEAAARVCVEVAAWLAGNDVLACRYGSWDSLAQATGGWETPDARIQKTYEQRGVGAIHDRLMIAAGCAQKDKTYWAGRTVALFASTVGASTVGPGGKIVVTPANGEWPFRYCSYAGTLAGKSDVSNVAGAAFQGCEAISSYMNSVIPERQSTCNGLQAALAVVSQNPGRDILENERANVKALLEMSYQGLSCVAPGAAPVVVANAAPTQSVEQRALALVNQISGEIGQKDTNLNLAKTWEDRGEYARACSYYSQGLRGLARIYTLYLELTHVTGDAAYTAKAKTFEAAELEIRAYARPECKAHGHPIF